MAILVLYHAWIVLFRYLVPAWFFTSPIRLNNAFCFESFRTVCSVCCSDGDGKPFLQKERLLRFDRDFARRTEVFDDQADYQAPSTWMTEEEKEEAEENQLKHLESLKRSKQTLKLAI